jgi:type VI secretion system secreted protein VgrG
VLKIISAKKSIEIAAAEEILLTAKGSYIKINGAGIEHGTPAKWIVYSATKTLTGPKELPYALPKSPLNEMFVYLDKKTHQPIPDFAYKIVRNDGTVFRGITNERGEAIALSGYRVDDFQFYADDEKE